MEGSRHEKAALISVAYLIGAVTVFIGLYSTSDSSSEPQSYLSIPNTSVMPATVVMATDSVGSEPVVKEEVAPDQVTGNVTYSNGVLAIQTTAGRKLLSFNPATSGLEVSAEFAQQGAHIGLLPYVTAPGERFVFFCEQKDVSGFCSPFIYDALEEKVYAVKADSTDLVLPLEEAQLTIWDDNGLSTPRFLVVNPDKPWLWMTKSNE